MRLDCRLASTCLYIMCTNAFNACSNTHSHSLIPNKLFKCGYFLCLLFSSLKYSRNSCIPLIKHSHHSCFMYTTYMFCVHITVDNELLCGNSNERVCRRHTLIHTLLTFYWWATQRYAGSVYSILFDTCSGNFFFYV